MTTTTNQNMTHKHGEHTARTREARETHDRKQKPKYKIKDMKQKNPKPNVSTFCPIKWSIELKSHHKALASSKP